MQPLAFNVKDTLHTERLTIRCPRPGDGEKVFDATMDSIDELREFPASLPWATRAPSVEMSEAFCRDGYENFAARRDFPFLMLLGDSQTVIGCGGLHRPNWPISAFDIGWWGRSPYLGHGLITEGVHALLRFAFADLRAKRVQALVDERNARSRRLCERVGLTLEGTRHDCAPEVGRSASTIKVYVSTDRNHSRSSSALP